MILIDKMPDGKHGLFLSQKKLMEIRYLPITEKFLF